MILSELLDSREQVPLLTLRMIKLKRSIIKLLTNEEKTIVELCKETEFSIPTVTKVLAELMEAGIVFEKGKIGTSGGRRPVIYGVNPNSAFFMGVDVKRDSVSFGLQNFKNELVYEAIRLPYKLEDNMESLDVLCGMINELDRKSVV